MYPYSIGINLNYSIHTFHIAMISLHDKHWWVFYRAERPRELSIKTFAMLTHYLPLLIIRDVFPCRLLLPRANIMQHVLSGKPLILSVSHRPLCNSDTYKRWTVYPLRRIPPLYFHYQSTLYLSLRNKADQFGEVRWR